MTRVGRTGSALALSAIVAVAAAGCAATEPNAAWEEATVVHVVDGDTFDAEFPDGDIERIRPPQIDAPEVDECGYETSGAALEELILGETVDLVPTEHGPGEDPHGRLLRAAEVDGDDVGQLLVRSGLARWVPQYADEDQRLAAMYESAEDHARGESAGLWSSCGWQ